MADLPYAESLHSKEDRPSFRRTSNLTVASSPVPFSNNFFDGDEATSQVRATFVKVMAGGTFMLILAILLFFPIYWGALWRTPRNAHKIRGVVVVRPNSLLLIFHK
jgi:hypothetical protein